LPLALCLKVLKQIPMCTVRWQQWSVILHFYIPNGPFNEPADALLSAGYRWEKKSSVVEKYAQFKTTKRQGFHNEVYLYVMRLWSWVMS